jgi:hypothetical protein
MKALIFILACAPYLFAQDVTAVSTSAHGAITGADTACSSISCVWISAPVNTGSASVQLSGTFVATVQFEGSVGGSVWTALASTAGPTSATAAGLFQFNLSGIRFVRVRSSAYTSGTIVVDVASSTASVGSGGSGNVTVKSNGTTIGSRSIFNFATPTGIINTITDNGVDSIVFNQALDPTQVVTTKIGTIQMPVGGCAGGTFATSWALGVSQTGSCLGGTYPVMNLLTTGTPTNLYWFQWPADFNNAGAVSAYVKFTDFAGSGGNAQFDVSIACQAAGSTVGGTPSFNALTSTGSITLTPSANTEKEVTISNLNITNCSPHTMAALNITRNNGVAGNSVDGINILSVSLDHARN